LGGGENMFTNWLLVGGGDITNCASTNEHFLSK
jgi:hypothetical protein